MATLPVRRFSEFLKTHPKSSDSRLLNSNNQTGFTGDADVVVAGAGIVGLCYAIHLKNISPHLKIEVFEKSKAPVQKIGESTLSSFTKFINGGVLSQDYLLRLFGLKDGLQFYCIDEQGLSITSGDVGGLDLSFQLDRRVSELFFTMWAQNMGINVYHGVDIDFELPKNNGIHTPAKLGWSIPSLWSKTSKPITPFETPRVVLKDSSETIGNHVNARLVCDATGFSRKLTSKFGKREKFEGWNCDAYWAYFKEKDNFNVDNPVEHWDYPATKHMCFPEGWGWFIKLISWHHASLGNLMDLIASIIDNANRGISPDDIPCTKELSAIFDCPFESITSIGWAVRDDYKLPPNLESYGNTEGEQKFNFFQRRYPTLDRLMTENYELLPSYYYDRSYFVRKNMAFRSPVVAGEGWFAIGNSAGFTNPLISPGMNSGIGSAFLAATLSEQILSAPKEDSKAVMQKSVEVYQSYHHDYMMVRLNQMNRFWYSMFRDHRLFEALVRCYWCLGTDSIGIHYDGTFTAKDLKWLVGAGGDAFYKFSGEVLKVLTPFDGAALCETAVEKVEELSQQCLRSRHELYPENKWGRYLRNYDDTLQKRPGKIARDPGSNFIAVRCLGCKSWVFDYANLCPICGTGRVGTRKDDLSAKMHAEEMLMT